LTPHSKYLIVAKSILKRYDVSIFVKNVVYSLNQNKIM